jgi:hypothetical protein
MSNQATAAHILAKCARRLTGREIERLQKEADAINYRLVKKP